MQRPHYGALHFQILLYFLLKIYKVEHLTDVRIEQNRAEHKFQCRLKLYSFLSNMLLIRGTMSGPLRPLVNCSTNHKVSKHIVVLLAASSDAGLAPCHGLLFLMSFVYIFFLAKKIHNLAFMLSVTKESCRGFLTLKPAYYVFG